MSVGAESLNKKVIFGSMPTVIAPDAPRAVCAFVKCYAAETMKAFAFPSKKIQGFFVFKQKTAYEITHSDWSSDVCASDLHPRGREHARRPIRCRRRGRGEPR